MRPTSTSYRFCKRAFLLGHYITVKTSKAERVKLGKLIEKTKFKNLTAIEKKEFEVIGLTARQEKPLTYIRANSLLSYDPDTGLLIWKKKKGNSIKPGDLAGGADGNIKIDRTSYRITHVIWLIVTQRFPSINKRINCVDGNERNYIFANLEEVQPKRISRNRKLAKNNLYGATGIRQEQHKWVANIHVDGVTHHLGTFNMKSEALYARKLAEKKYGYHPNAGRNEAL